MTKKLVATKPKTARAGVAVYRRIRDILESARAITARSVNTTQVAAYWLIGREIVEEEQRGKRRAGYGERLLEDLSDRLKADFGGGFSMQNLRYMRQFYATYPQLLSNGPIRHAVRGELESGPEIRHAVRGESAKAGSGTKASGKFNAVVHDHIMITQWNENGYAIRAAC